MKVEKDNPMIRVFPNTGHQYVVIPLSKLLPDGDSEKVREFAENNASGWKPWDTFTPWVRYQYEDRSFDCGGPLLRLAIETNLGSCSNGILFDSEEVDAMKKMDDPETPYASYDEANIEEDYGRDRCIPLTYLPNTEDREIEVLITIHWIRSTGTDPVEVDLVIDLGNSRTVALLLEHPGNESISFGRRVQPVRFMPPGESFEVQNFNGSGMSFDDLSIIDSWFVLKRSSFAEMEPPYGSEKVLSVPQLTHDENGVGSSKRKILKYVANTFVEMSPALIGGGDSTGGARKALAEVPLDEDARFTMGSPKRYAWDDRAVGMSGTNYWSQMPSPLGESGERPFYFEKLDGLFRLFMDPEGQDWQTNGLPKESDLKHAPFRNSPPNFPRRDSICWFALSILEASYRQINSDNYLDLAKRRTLPRRLSRVSVLYPSGWTKLEKDAYFNQWKRAIGIFSTTHLGGNGRIAMASSDRLTMPTFEERGLDEAMCAQLPVVYSEVCAMGGEGKAWFDLYGDGKKVRVMNVDIGGGTTDFSVIEYRPEGSGLKNDNSLRRNDPTARLSAKLLYKDGKSIAGDALVKKIIEDILIPEWITSAMGEINHFSDDEKVWLGRMFSEPESILFSDVDSRLPNKLSRVARLVFLPVVNNVLSKLGGKENQDENVRVKVSSFANRQILQELNTLTKEMLSRKIHSFQPKEFDIFPSDAELTFSKKGLEQRIDRVFLGLFDDLLQIFREFPCDLVILSGKPSELSRIKERIHQALPIMPQRIINLKGYDAGFWYPFAEMGKVTDAKTAAVVGAALHQDILNGNLNGFSLKEEPHLERTPHYWGGINRNARPEEFFKNLLFCKRELEGSRESFAECEIPIGSIIGRKSFRHAKSNPEPVYQLFYESETKDESLPHTAKVKLKWSMNDESGEHLELAEVIEDKEFPSFRAENLSLKLQTQMDETHWLDSPKLKVSELMHSQR